MRQFLSVAAMSALLFVGCNKSPEGGTPGTSSSFTISAPTMSTTIKQDNTESVKLTLNRGSDFKKSVKLTATAPDKIKAEFSKDSVTSSDAGDVMLKIIVAKDAPIGDQTIHVTGTPDGGSPTSVEVKLHVEKNP
jgi:uncharacterized membrane protein